MSRRPIREVIESHRREVRFCYERELGGDPHLQGRVTIRFVVAPSGVVETATVQESSVANHRLGQCITEAVKRWTFPATEGDEGVVIVYPFDFQIREGATEGGGAEEAPAEG